MQIYVRMRIHKTRHYYLSTQVNIASRYRIVKTVCRRPLNEFYNQARFGVDSDRDIGDEGLLLGIEQCRRVNGIGCSHC